MLALEDNHLAPATAEVIDYHEGDGGVLRVRIRPPITEVSHLCERRVVGSDDDHETVECIACGRRWAEGLV